MFGIELWEVLDVYGNVPPVSTKQLSSIEVGMSMFDTPFGEDKFVFVVHGTPVESCWVV